MSDVSYTCPVDAVMSVIGGKWKILLLWHLRRTPHRYGELRRAIPRITEKTLAPPPRPPRRLGPHAPRRPHRRPAFRPRILTRFSPQRFPRPVHEITWDDFEQVELRAGTVTRVEDFPEARNPAYKIWADFGEEIGTLKSSAQVTDLYEKNDLVGTQIIGVVNFPPKQIGPLMSEFLVTGFRRADGAVVLAQPEQRAPDGGKLA